MISPNVTQQCSARPYGVINTFAMSGLSRFELQLARCSLSLPTDPKICISPLPPRSIRGGALSRCYILAIVPTACWLLLELWDPIRAYGNGFPREPIRSVR